MINIKTDDITDQHTLTYDFYNLQDEKSAKTINPEVNLYFVTSQNYLPHLIGHHPHHLEGREHIKKATLGQYTSIRLQALHYKYLNRKSAPCRDSSYMEILLSRLNDNQ